MEIKAVKFRKGGFYSQPFAFGGEEGVDKFDKNIRYRGSLQNYLIDTGDEIILLDTGLPAGTPEEKPNEDSLAYTGKNICSYMEAFKALGYKPEQVTKILLTHKHADHSGEISSLPNAKVYVNEEELSAAELQGKDNLVPVKFTDGAYYNLNFWQRNNKTMDFQLLLVEEADLQIFKHDMQEAFQLGAAAWEENLDEEILPESHINKSLSTKGAIAYKAVVDGELLGGAIVVINGKHGHLDFLYVNSGTQSKGIGQMIWNTIEEKHPEVALWETCTPYFDTRNLHFYINCCGFAAVEFYNPKHIDPKAPDGDGGSDLFFRFEKRMK